jgi:hypothetical protein
LPGFDQFLLTPSEEELKAAAESGPIVVINASYYRFDAFIIDTRQILAIPMYIILIIATFEVMQEKQGNLRFLNGYGNA